MLKSFLRVTANNSFFQSQRQAFQPISNSPVSLSALWTFRQRFMASSSTSLPQLSLINGRLVAGIGEPQPIFNPSLGTQILSIPELSLDQVNEAVNAAADAFPTWSR